MFGVWLHIEVISTDERTVSVAKLLNERTVSVAKLLKNQLLGKCGMRAFRKHRPAIGIKIQPSEASAFDMSHQKCYAGKRKLKTRRRAHYSPQRRHLLLQHQSRIRHENLHFGNPAMPSRRAAVSVDRQEQQVKGR